MPRSNCGGAERQVRHSQKLGYFRNKFAHARTWQVFASTRPLVALASIEAPVAVAITDTLAITFRMLRLLLKGRSPADTCKVGRNHEQRGSRS